MKPVFTHFFTNLRHKAAGIQSLAGITLLQSTFAKIILLALLYIITGHMGLLLAVPPGYATIIWPPSGIALGMLIIHGWRLWPGVLIGSFLLNLSLAGGYSPSEGLVIGKTMAAFGIAVGSTLQAVAGRALIARFIGLPLTLNHINKVVALFLLGGPVACIIAASIGTGMLYTAGVVAQEQLLGNWFTWWAGDIFGMVVFLPLMLVAPGSPNRVLWRGKGLGTLPAVAMLSLIVPLGLTFYAWKITSENVYGQNQLEFQSLALENEKALLHRLDSYENALLGGEGFLQGSDFVSPKEWRSYVEALHIQDHFPGINGIGLIHPLEAGKEEAFLRELRKAGAPEFSIHPPTDGKPLYIISYIEPYDKNKQALGLNIAFEQNRMQAAELSRDSGKPAITRRITLVQDEEKTAGFLLMHPMYRQGMPINTVEERREALRAWLYAPFIAKNFLHDLTQSQGYTLNLRIYDGQESKDNLIYSSDNTDKPATAPLFTMRKELDVMQQKWRVVWQSTPNYEQSRHSNSAFFILVGGLLFTGLFGLFLMLTVVRRADTMEWMGGEQNFALSVAVFLVLSAGAGAMSHALHNKELAYIKAMVEEETSKIELLLRSQIDDKLLSLKRMAQRWEVAGGTPFHLWQSDARNYTDQLAGLKTVEWADSSYHVRWAEPLKGNEKAIGLNIQFDAARQQALRGAAEKDQPTLTPPLSLVQGYQAFIAYLPLHVNGRFDGFMVGIFSIQEFFGHSITKDTANKYSLAISYDNQDYFQTSAQPALAQDDWSVTKNLQIYDKQWQLRLTPTDQFVASQQTSLPVVVLIAGLMIAALSGLMVRYIMISRIKSHHLRASEVIFRSAMEDASIGMALVRPDGRWLEVNPSLCDLVGYDREDLLKTDFQTITHPDDLDQDLDYVRQMLAGEIKTYKMEKRYLHKNGSVIWVLLSVSLARDAAGNPKYFVKQMQDITEQREVERMKTEFISIVSHELRTPLTSIRGSLGLILGVFSKELPEKVTSLMHIAHDNCARLILLINDILDIDKIASGNMRFDMKEEPLATITRQAVAANEAYAQKYKAHLNLQDIDDTIRVELDAARYIQILSNLISNAAKFSPPGSSVEIFALVGREHVRICVRDHGSGIPEDFKTRIFGKFSQADSSLSTSNGGTGLGLHITKQLVEYMNGQIGFDTELGKGTTFWIEFPLANPYHLNDTAIYKAAVR